MKKWPILILLFTALNFVYSGDLTKNDPKAYILYQQGNDKYKVKRYQEARDYYLQLIHQYPDSQFVPYAVYMLSFLETDTVKIIDYLGIIKEKYPDFRYWTNAVEKLGDIYYLIGNHPAAIEQYQALSTDKALYMQALIYSAGGLPEKAVKKANDLLLQTQDNGMAYKGFIIEIKIFLDSQNYSNTYPLLQQAVKLKKWAFDNGARILYYTGKYYFYRQEVQNHYEKSFYVFSLLKSVFPLAMESSLADQYLSELNKNNIVKPDPVRWLADAYTTPPEIPYQRQTLSVLEEIENKAEAVSSEAEGNIGNMIKAELLEYVVRIGEYKDLSVANISARDIVKKIPNVQLGIYYRNDLYYSEIRGFKKIEEAKEIAKKLSALGYSDAKVVESMKIVEYNK
jgi:tetratricopeptide (TPR) repeat protein